MSQKKKKKIKISELDFNNIGSWPQQAKTVFCVLLAAFIVVMTYLLVIRGKVEELEGLERREADLRAQFETEQAARPTSNRCASSWRRWSRCCSRCCASCPARPRCRT